MAPWLTNKHHRVARLPQEDNYKRTFKHGICKKKNLTSISVSAQLRTPATEPCVPAALRLTGRKIRHESHGKRLKNKARAYTHNSCGSQGKRKPDVRHFAHGPLSLLIENQPSAGRQLNYLGKQPTAVLNASVRRRCLLSIYRVSHTTTTSTNQVGVRWNFDAICIQVDCSSLF